MSLKPSAIATASLPFGITLDLPVRTYDIDFAGVVNNIVYIRWLEDLRLEMLSRYFPLETQLQDGFAPVIVHTNIDYRRPIRLGDRPLGTMGVESIDSLRLRVKAEISVGQTVAAIAEQVTVFVSLEENRPIRIPASLKQAYQERLSQLASLHPPSDPG